MTPPTLKDLDGQQFAWFTPKTITAVMNAIAEAGGAEKCRLRLYTWAGQPYLVVATEGGKVIGGPYNESIWCPPLC